MALGIFITAPRRFSLLIVMGCEAVPAAELPETYTTIPFPFVSVYVPLRTIQVSPARMGDAAHFCGLRHGLADVPGLESLPVVAT